MKILHVTPTYYPATYFGGPIFSTHALCNELVQLPGVVLRVLTSDMAGPTLSDRVRVSDFPTRFPAGYHVYFTRRIMQNGVSPGLLLRLWAMIGWADVVLLTGTYSFPTIPTLLVSRLRNKPVVWSPRGALQASHLWKQARRPKLKWAWEIVCRLIKPRQCVLHVTAEAEKQASCARLPEFEAVIIPNGVEVPLALPARCWKPHGVLRLMFISRIHPNKGLDVLLRAIPSLKQVTLDVYGTGDLGYVQSMKHLAAELGLGARVRFHGHVDGEAKRNAFFGADLFVLPTHSESFGMVVAEALAHGVPAVVTRGAPWPELETRNCGRWVTNTVEALSEAIERLYGAGLEPMGARGRQWMQADFSWKRRAEDMNLLFENMIWANRKMGKFARERVPSGP